MKNDRSQPVPSDNVGELISAALNALPRGFKTETGENGLGVFATSKSGRRWELRVDSACQLWRWAPEGEFETQRIREMFIATGLGTEIRFPGMRMTAKAPKCSTILRKEYGMTGAPLSLYMQFTAFRQIARDPKVAEIALKEGVR